MDRRSFLKWLGGGIGAAVALSTSTVAEAERLFGVTGAIDPEKLLWVPGESRVYVPDAAKLIVEPVPAGVGVYRLSTRKMGYGASNGTYWFDRDGVLVDAFNQNGQPMAVLDGTGPDLLNVRRELGDNWGWSTRTESKNVRGGVLHRWPGLIPAPPERDFIARLRLEL